MGRGYEQSAAWIRPCLFSSPDREDHKRFISLSFIRRPNIFVIFAHKTEIPPFTCDDVAGEEYGGVGQ